MIGSERTASGRLATGNDGFSWVLDVVSARDSACAALAASAPAAVNAAAAIGRLRRRRRCCCR